VIALGAQSKARAKAAFVIFVSLAISMNLLSMDKSFENQSQEANRLPAIGAALEGPERSGLPLIVDPCHVAP
jgi:hypothetical protein